MTSQTFKRTALLTGAALLTAGIALAAPKADFDQDGVVTQSEFVTAAAERFSLMDTDGDAYISKDEMRIARAARKEARKAERFAKLDTNSDGLISKAEYDAAREAKTEKRKARMAEKAAERLAKLDTDRDGVISEAEQEVAKAEWSEKRAERKAKYKERRSDHKLRKDKQGLRGDTDGDNMLSRAEYDAKILKAFTRMDRNNDGVLSKEENRRGKRWKRGHRHGG